MTRGGSVLAGTPASSADIAGLGWQTELARLGAEGYVIRLDATVRATKNTCRGLEPRAPSGFKFAPAR